MTDVLLVQPPIRDFYLTPKRTIPYGLASIAAALIARGFEVDILDALARPRAARPRFRRRCPIWKSPRRPDISPSPQPLSFRPGFDTSPQGSGAGPGCGHLRQALRLREAHRSRRRAAHPTCAVDGRHHRTALESVLASPADYVLRGRGSIVPLLAEALREGRPLGDIPGIVQGRRRLSSQSTAGHISDGFPLPAFELVNQRYYRRNGRGSAVIVASRGCPLRCSYCSIGGAAWLPYRLRPVAQVLAEIETAVVRHGAGFIDFEDENLSLDRGWILDLLDGITRRFGERHWTQP
jgi:hypothetical protein